LWPASGRTGKLTPSGPLVPAYCGSHFRRRFHDIAKAVNAPIASEALRRFSEPFDIEAEISGLSTNDHSADRQERTQLLVGSLGIWLDRQLDPNLSCFGR